MAESRNDSALPDARPVKKAYEQVADQLRSQIISGQLKVGDRLPNEMTLAKQFGTSRSTVREALRTLASLTLIQTKAGASGGITVVHPRVEEIQNYIFGALSLLARSDEVGVDELLVSRKLLEVPASGIAAKSGERDTVERIQALVPRDIDNMSLSDLAYVNREFHRLVVNSTGNRVLSLMAEPIFSVLQTRFHREDWGRDVWVRISTDHAKIAELIRAGDPGGTQEMMASHLDYVSTVYKRIWSEGPSS